MHKFHTNLTIKIETKDIYFENSNSGTQFFLMARWYCFDIIFDFAYKYTENEGYWGRGQNL